MALAHQAALTPKGFKNVLLKRFKNVLLVDKTTINRNQDLTGEDLRTSQVPELLGKRSNENELTSTKSKPVQSVRYLIFALP
jgi:hypothetical protein